MYELGLIILGTIGGTGIVLIAVVVTAVLLVALAWLAERNDDFVRASAAEADRLHAEQVTRAGNCCGCVDCDCGGGQ